MSEKRLEQIKQIANELFPDDRDADKYTGFIFGAMWADKTPESDNQWHDVNDRVDPTKDCINKSNAIMYIDGDCDIFTASIDAIKDECLTFEKFVKFNDVRYWAYEPDYIFDKLSQLAMEDNRDEE